MTATSTTTEIADLESILLADRWFAGILQTVRELDLPNWVVGAGVTWNLVWDRLHGFDVPTPAHDVDVAYFDTTDTSEARDNGIAAKFSRRQPGVPWEVTNGAEF